MTEARPPHLRNAPLQVVAIDVRFPAEPLSTDEIKALSRALRSTYPIPKAEQGVTLQIGPDGLKQQAQVQRHVFTSLDEAHQVAVLPGTVVLEASTSYEGFQLFADRWLEVSTAVSSVLAPTHQLRLGLRYVNQLVVEGDDVTMAAVEGRVNPVLLSPYGNEEFPYNVTSSLQELRIEDAETKGTLRHGLQVASLQTLPGRAAQQQGVYVIDLDFYDDTPGEYSAEWQLERLKLFNSRIWKIFHWSVTAEEYERMEPEERNGSRT